MIEKMLDLIWEAARDQFPAHAEHINEVQSHAFIVTWTTRDDPMRPNKTAQAVLVHVRREVLDTMGAAGRDVEKIAGKAASTVRIGMQRYPNIEDAPRAYQIEVDFEALDA